MSEQCRRSLPSVKRACQGTFESEQSASGSPHHTPVHAGQSAHVYDEFARWLHRQQQLGVVSVPDPEATAAVLLASLTAYPILDTLIGHTPGDIERERFITAWVEHAHATLDRNR